MPHLVLKSPLLGEAKTEGGGAFAFPWVKNGQYPEAIITIFMFLG